MESYTSVDAFGRPDIVTSLARLPSAFPTTRLVSVPIQSEDEELSVLTKSLPPSLLRKQQAAELSLNLWRSRDRLLIRQVGLILCLNIGTEPPDRERSVGSEEAGVDLSQVQANSATMIQNAMDEVSRRLQRQYERLEPKARLRTAADPKLEDIRKLVTKLRGHAQRSETGIERILIHYNGHGVPRPTIAGEIWGFNEGYTAYVPLNITEVAVWAGSPSMFVFDCDNAGRLIPPLVSYYKSKSLDKGNQSSIPKDEPLDVLVLGACGSDASLPNVPGLPTDVFTACLTTPLKMSLRWAIHTGGVTSFPRAFQSLVDRLPGRISDRKSPLGELHWLLTTITDTIAWTCLPRPLFFRLFRQDILCASLFRNFLLADKIMRVLGVVPLSVPSLPNTHNHPLWLEFDAALNRILSTLPATLGYSVEDIERLDALGLVPDVASAMILSGRRAPEFPLVVDSPDLLRSPRKALKTYWGIDAIDEDDLATLPDDEEQRLSSSLTSRQNNSNQGTIVISEEGFVDPLSLSVPPAASATPSQRVLFLRRLVQSACLQRSSLNQTFADTEGLSLSNSGITTFFRDSLLSFETWLDRVSATNLLHRAPMLVDLFDFFDHPIIDEVNFRSNQHIISSHCNSSMYSSGTSNTYPVLRSSMRIRAPPELPVLLQMVLSKDHRLWAMELLARFVRLGPEATNLALLMGFSSYLIKLVDTDVPELRPSLVIIWACILSTARSIQSICDDLINKANGFRFFEICSGVGNNFSEEVVESARFVLHKLTVGRSRQQFLTLPTENSNDPVSHLFRSKLLNSDPKVRQDAIRKIRASLVRQSENASGSNELSPVGVDCAAQLYNFSHEFYTQQGLVLSQTELIWEVCNDLCDASLAYLRGAWVVAKCILSSDGSFSLLASDKRVLIKKAGRNNDEKVALTLSSEYLELPKGVAETGPPPLDFFAAALISATAPKRSDSDVAADADRKTAFALKDTMLSDLCTAVWLSALLFDGDPIIRFEAGNAVSSIIFSAPFHLQSMSLIAAQSLLDCAAGGPSSLGRFLFGSDNHMHNLTLPGLPPGLFTVPILTMFVAQESTVILSSSREGGPRLAEEEYKKNALTLSAVRLFGPRGILYTTVWTSMCQSCLDGALNVSLSSQKFIRRILFLVARACAGLQLNTSPVNCALQEGTSSEFTFTSVFSSSKSFTQKKSSKIYIDGFSSQLLPCLVTGHEIALASFSDADVKSLLHMSRSLNPVLTLSSNAAPAAFDASDIASEVPRLSPKILARVNESRVIAARLSMKKFRQHVLIQTEGYSTSLLFHPFIDVLISIDGAGTAATFSTTNGDRLTDFVVGSTPTIKLWNDALHEELQASFPQDGNTGTMKRRLQAQKSLVSGSTKVSLATSLFRQPLVQVPRPRLPSPVHFSTWIDEASGCHLLTGSEDGTVKVWSGHDLVSLSTSKSSLSTIGGMSTSLSSPRMLTVFKAAPAASSRSFAMTYLPFNTSLIASGGNVSNKTNESMSIRVWDISSSICKQLIQLPSSTSAVSCLASPWPGTDTILAGTNSGAIHVIDMRIRDQSSIVRTFSEHQTHVVNIALSKIGSCYAVASASFASDVRFWDLRIERSLRSVLAQERGKLTSLVAHDFAPLLLTGCLKHGATILTNSGDEISRIERHDSFNSEPLGPITSAAWHPTRLEMAIASSDNRISIRRGDTLST